MYDDEDDQEYIHEDIIVIDALNGTEIDITEQVERFAFLGKYYMSDSVLTPSGAHYAHKTGWHIIRLCGVEEAMILIDDMVRDRHISEPFGGYLRAKWTELAVRIKAAEAADCRWSRWSATQTKAAARR